MLRRIVARPGSASVVVPPVNVEPHMVNIQTLDGCDQTRFHEASTYTVRHSAQLEQIARCPFVVPLVVQDPPAPQTCRKAHLEFTWVTI